MIDRPIYLGQLRVETQIGTKACKGLQVARIRGRANVQDPVEPFAIVKAAAESAISTGSRPVRPLPDLSDAPDPKDGERRSARWILSNFLATNDKRAGGIEDCFLIRSLAVTK
jgi:hypothetical protein